MTVDELMALADAISDRRAALILAHERASADRLDKILEKFESSRLALRAALEAVVADVERLDWLQANPGCNLISDDAERWALSSCGFQPVPEDGGFTCTVTINSIVTVDEWRTGVRAAIDTAGRAEGCDA